MITARTIQLSRGWTFVAGQQRLARLPKRRPRRTTDYCVRTATRTGSTSTTATTLDTETTTSTTIPDTATNDASDKQKLTSIRLYRILQRQCRELQRELQQQQQRQQQQQSNEQRLLLLQTPLEPRAAGSSRILVENRSASPQQQQADIWKLFYHWNTFVSSVVGEKVENSAGDDAEEFFFDEWYRQLLASIFVNDTDKRELEGWAAWATGPSRWTTVTTLKNAIRTAFRFDLTTPQQDNNLLIKYQHTWAIRAYQILQQQQQMLQLTSISQLHNVQVTATSKWIGQSLTRHLHHHQQQQRQQELEDEHDSSSNSSLKYRFAYRIRIENQSLTDTIQLLGRTWYIQEYRNSITNHIMEPMGEPIHVYAPQTGAVGQLPVLQPGQAFEYVSGAELSTPQGQMKGCFHLAIVPHDTPSAVVGMPVAALEPAAHHHRFEVPVRPFPLRVDPTSYVASDYNDDRE